MAFDVAKVEPVPLTPETIGPLPSVPTLKWEFLKLHLFLIVN